MGFRTGRFVAFVLTCVTLNLLFACVLVVDVELYKLTVLQKDITETAGYVAIVTM